MDTAFKNWFKIIKESIANAEEVERNAKLFEEAYLLGKNTRRTTRQTKEAHPVYSFCVEFWLKKFHPNWTFNASEGKALNEIIDKMTKYFIAGHQCEPTAQQLFDFFEHFCLKLPNFYKSKNLKILNQNFDGIISEIKASRNPNSDFHSKNSGQRFSEFAR